MASLAAAVEAKLTTAYAAANAATSDPQQRISIYRSTIPGTPTNRYALIFAGDPRRGNSTVDGVSRDGHGHFQVTVAATGPNASTSPDQMTDWLVKLTLNALVDSTLTIDGYAPFRVQQDEVDTYPVPVEVVADRVTVEQALQFVFLADRA